MSVTIEARGGDRYRVTAPDGSTVEVAGAPDALALAEGLRAAWDNAKHPRARGGKFASVPGHDLAPRERGGKKAAKPLARVVDRTGPRPGSVADQTGLRARRGAPKDVPSSKLKNRADPEGDLPGPPPKGEETKPEEPLGSPGRPLETDDVVEAAKQLAAGKYVQLKSKNQVSTLLKELQKEVESARAAGEKAPDINLCKVTVKGSNLFCVESKGVPRIQMPQLKGDATTVRAGSPASKLAPDKRGEVSVEAQFRDHLVRHGVKVEDGEELASHLKATQNELNGAKVAGIANAIDNGVVIEGPGLFISRDNYVVDGHHRWAATVGVDYEDGKDDLKMPVQRIDMDIIDILRESNAFAAAQGIPQAGLGDFSAKMLAGAPPLVGEGEAKKAVKEARRTPAGMWRAEMPDGRLLDYTTRELAEAGLAREWDKIKHPRARGGRFADVPGSGRTVGSEALGNRRVIGTPEEELARGRRNARMRDNVAAGNLGYLRSPGRTALPNAAQAFGAHAKVKRGDRSTVYEFPSGNRWEVWNGPSAVAKRVNPDGSYDESTRFGGYGYPYQLHPALLDKEGIGYDRERLQRQADRARIANSPGRAGSLTNREIESELGRLDRLDPEHRRGVEQEARARGIGGLAPAAPQAARGGMSDDAWAAIQSDKDYPFFASPGRSRDRIPSVTKHAMGFEPGDYLVPTRSFSVHQGHGYSQLTNDTAAFHPWHRYKVKQIIGTNQLTVEGDQPGTELYIPTFDQSSVRRVQAGRPTMEFYDPKKGPTQEQMDRNARVMRGDGPKRVASPATDGQLVPHSPGRADHSKLRGSPIPGQTFVHPDHGPVTIDAVPDFGATDRPGAAWVHVTDVNGRGHTVRNGDLAPEDPAKTASRAKELQIASLERRLGRARSDASGRGKHTEAARKRAADLEAQLKELDRR